MAGRLLAILLLAGALPAQEPAVFKMTTRQVQVSIVVHDKKGQPVADLTKEDFVLYDKGQEQQIRFFAKETSLPPAVPKGLAPGIVSNRVTPGANGSTQQLSVVPTALTVILIDGLNTKFADVQNAEQALVEFMAEVRPSDPVIVYGLTDSLRLLRPEAPQGMPDLLKRFLMQASAAIPLDQQRRVLTTLDALRTIAGNVAGIPGRKNLVWLTDGFPVLSGLTPSGRMGRNFQNYQQDVQRTVQVLDNVNVAIYPVDARGVIGTFDMSPSTAPSTRTRSRRGAAAMDAAAKQDIFLSEGTMTDVAERTGGRAFMNSNDLTGFIRQAVADTRISYAIAYSPTHDQWDGRFREIKVKVKRPGLEVRTRKGYYAFPQAGGQEARQSALDSAMNSPLDSTGLGLMAKLVTRPTKQSPLAGLSFVLDANDITFRQDDQGLWTAELDATMVVRDDQGVALNRRSQAVRVRLKQDQYDQLRKTGMLALSADVDAPANSARARLVVRDLATGMMGSVDVPFGATD